MRGVVQMESEAGKMEVVLSNSSLSEIFKIIKEDAIYTAQQNANRVDRAIEDAIYEGYLNSPEGLLEQAKNKIDENL